jgi:hypothetical protein
MIALQRAAGNQAAIRMLARQGQPAAPPATPADDAVAKAVQSGDPGDIDAITDFTKVSEADRIRFIGILNGFPGDAHGLIPSIWQSFGDEGLPHEIEAHRDVWDQSAAGFGGPVQLLPVSLVEKVKGQYEKAIQDLATDNLIQNAKFVDTRMEQMGLKSGEAKPLSPVELTELRHAMQSIAWDVWSMRQNAKKLTNQIIGVRSKKPGFLGIITFSILMGGENESVWFDPHHPPPEEELQEVWRPLKDEWDRAEKGIAAAAGKYPEIYQLVAADDDDALLNFSRVIPEAFGEQQRQVLQALLDRINHVNDMVAHRDLDLMGFDLMQQRLAAGGGEWATGFKAYMADLLVKQHVGDESTVKQLSEIGFSVSLVLDVIGLEVFGVILGAIAAGLNLAAAVGESAEASKQQEAARTTPLMGTELVSQAKADEQAATATAHELSAAVMAIIAAIAAGAVGAKALAKAVQMARLRTVLGTDEAVNKLLPMVGNDTELLHKLGSKAGDAETLEALLGKVPPEKLGPLLDRIGSGKLTNSLLGNCPNVEQLGRFLDRVPNAEQLDRLLAGTAPADLGRLEQVLATVGEGAPGSISFNIGGELEAGADQIIINPGRPAMSITNLRRVRPDNLVIEARAEQIPFPNGCGRLVEGNKLPNSIDWEAAAPEFKRVLVPGGKVKITVFGPGGPLRKALTKQGFALDPPPFGDFDYPSVTATRP